MAPAAGATHPRKPPSAKLLAIWHIEQLSLPSSLHWAKAASTGHSCGDCLQPLGVGLAQLPLLLSSLRVAGSPPRPMRLAAPPCLAID